MTYLLRAIHAGMLIGTILIISSFSNYMERTLPRELLVTSTPSKRTRQRTFPRIVSCVWSDRHPTATTINVTTSNLQCQPVLQSLSALKPTHLKHPEERLYPLKPRLTTPLLSSEPDITRFYPDANVSSSDLPSMERRIYPKHEYDPHCEPIDPSWQSTFYPVCNELHAHSMVDNLLDESMSLLSSKGFWRHAWKQKQDFVGSRNDANAAGTKRVVTVWKTFK
jgi:hypothetical protein